MNTNKTLEQRIEAYYSAVLIRLKNDIKSYK